MADQAGYERQSAGPQVFDHGWHERPCQRLLKRFTGRSILSFVPMGNNDTGDGLLGEAGRENSVHHHPEVRFSTSATNVIEYLDLQFALCIKLLLHLQFSPHFERSRSLHPVGINFANHWSHMMDSSISSQTFQASGSEEATYITSERYTGITSQLNYRMSLSIFWHFPFFKMTFDFNLSRLKYFVTNLHPNKAYSLQSYVCVKSNKSKLYKYYAP